jgi:transposase
MTGDCQADFEVRILGSAPEAPPEPGEKPGFSLIFSQFSCYVPSFARSAGAPAMRPLTDAEYAFLAPHLSSPRGRRPSDPRRTLDAILWIAATRLPWRALPEHLGRPDTAHRALRRWARSGHLEAALLATHAAAPEVPAAASLLHRLCRAFRRMARILPLASVLLARRLGLAAALPCAPRHLPDPDLSEIVRTAALRALDDPRAHPPSLFRLLGRLFRQAGGRLRAWRLK